MTCLDDAAVLELVEGRLAAPALAAIDDHLDACASCRDVVTAVARARAPGTAFAPGQAIGRYVIGELVGAGAMGQVYAAWQPELDRRVALKVLRDGAPDRLRREAQAMARLDHPNVVGVHEVGSCDAGVYVAMELVDGESLRAWAAPRRPWRAVVAVLAEVARGLAAVHAAGVVHRDVKPDNIIVGRDGRARVGDFGLARAGAAPAEPGGGALADGTSVAGTPAYMAPELLRGGAATAASDQFAFGVTAYEVLAGARPFAGASWGELARAIDAGAIRPLRGVPGWLDATIRRCLAADPARRFAAMTEVGGRLAAGAARARARVWLAAAAAAALASGATWFASRDRGGGDAPSCTSGAAEIATAWNPIVAERLAAAWPASPARASALAALAGWSTRWSGERDAACRAAATDPAPRVAARTRCLDQRRRELGALVDRVASTPQLGDRVLDALARLPAPSECRASDVSAGDPLPLDGARAAAAREVTAALPAVRAAIALGDARLAVAPATTIVATARASEHAPTLADALVAEADALHGAGRLADATIAARDAVAAAERGHADAIGARAWIARVAIAAELRELDAADDLGTIAAAAVDRAGAPPQLTATLARIRGLVAYNRGKLVEARALLVDARARFVALAGGAASIDVAAVDSALGSVARAAGELGDAETRHRAALATDRALRGPIHPDVARDLHNLAGVLRLRGELDRAVATYRDALAIELATAGEASATAALTRNSIALVLMARHDWAAARVELERARDALVAANHGDRAFAEHNLGLVDQATGDHRGALDHFARAAAVYAATIGADAGAPIRLALDRARSELAIGDRAAARRDAALAARAANAAGIEWIASDARALAANAAPIRGVEPEPAPIASRPTPDAAVKPKPAPAPAPVRDVGVYGASQPL